MLDILRIFFVVSLAIYNDVNMPGYLQSMAKGWGQQTYWNNTWNINCAKYHHSIEYLGYFAF